MESLIDSKLIGFFMISRRSVKVEEIQHYVYVFMLYMFIVGYAYFTSYFSVFKFNAIGYVGFVDIIKMAASSLFNVHILPYSFSFVILILLMKRDEGELRSVKMVPVNRNQPTIKKISILMYEYRWWFFAAYVSFASFCLLAGFMKSHSFENYKTYTLFSTMLAAIGFAAAILICYIVNLYMRVKNKSKYVYFTPVAILYFIECGFMSVLSGHNDAMRIVIGMEYTYLVDGKSTPKEKSARFVGVFGETYLLWNPEANSIIASKNEGDKEFKSTH
ncbi:hypothetical protein ACJ5N2_07875 [Aeromonas salmonicida]|jgi:hypothetical protein|uniref:hypothetical protein n=1 Tax=Aeromonas salmonicida TaxID=645 RepID=UPI0038B90B40